MIQLDIRSRTKQSDSQWC